MSPPPVEKGHGAAAAPVHDLDNQPTVAATIITWSHQREVSVKAHAASIIDGRVLQVDNLPVGRIMRVDSKGQHAVDAFVIASIAKPLAVGQSLPPPDRYIDNRHTDPLR